MKSFARNTLFGAVALAASLAAPLALAQSTVTSPPPVQSTSADVAQSTSAQTGDASTSVETMAGAQTDSSMQDSSMTTADVDATATTGSMQDSSMTAADANTPTAGADATATTGSMQDSSTTTAGADATATTGPIKKSWTDVDLDKDGNLTKAEAGMVPALSQVFDQADGNADGSLTTDEYKNYVAKVKGGASTGDDGN